MPIRPIVFMHGVTSSAAVADPLFERIKKDFPGAKTKCLTSFQRLDSLVPIQQQLPRLIKELREILKEFGNQVCGTR